MCVIHIDSSIVKGSKAIYAPALVGCSSTGLGDSAFSLWLHDFPFLPIGLLYCFVPVYIEISAVMSHKIYFIPVQKSVELANYWRISGYLAIDVLTS